MPILKFKPLTSSPPPPPSYQTKGAAGMDVSSAQFLTLRPGERYAVSTEYAVEVPPDHELQVRSRSGQSLKTGVVVLNQPGTIDEDYRGELKIILINMGTAPVSIERDQRIAQLVLMPVVRAEIQIAVELSKTERGENGFGSTGA
jgi:dUTP pyrophosphatase